MDETTLRIWSNRLKYLMKIKVVRAIVANKSDLECLINSNIA